jgi:hypothetical protein
MADYRVKFLRDFAEERAPKKPGASGFEIHTIPEGTEKTISEHSLRFFEERAKASGKPIVKVLGKDRETSATAGQTTVQLVPPQTSQTVIPTKTEIRQVAESAMKLLQGDLRQTAANLSEAIGLLLVPDVLELLSVQPDTVIVLESAQEDLKAGPSLHQSQEVQDALAQIHNLTLPPSKRK